MSRLTILNLSNLRIRLEMTIRVGGCFWSDFFLTKYVGNSHISLAMLANKGLFFWKGIMRICQKFYKILYGWFVVVI